MSKTKVWKARTTATAPGKIEHSGPPLDFSFLKLQDVHALRKERPRAGKRKPIEKDEDEEDTKKEAVAAVDKEDGDKSKDIKEQGVIVTKSSNVPQVMPLLSNHYVSL